MAKKIITEKRTMEVDLPVISYKGMEGYCNQDLLIWMDKNGMVSKWRDWHYGSTGGIVTINEKPVFLVYKHDVEAFLSGEKNND